MTTKTHGGARPGAGRKPGYRVPGAKHRKLRPILLSDEELALAQDIGAGNASYGVRRAIYHALDKDLDLAI